MHQCYNIFVVLAVLASMLPLENAWPRRHQLGSLTMYADWMRTAPILPSSFSVSESDFLMELKAALEQRRLSRIPRYLIFSDVLDVPHPVCSGTWVEFGVFFGNSVNDTARWRQTHCGMHTEKVYGFDTFTGLPEAWRDGFPALNFNMQGTLPVVEPNVELLKGLFNESFLVSSRVCFTNVGTPASPIAMSTVTCTQVQHRC